MSRVMIVNLTIHKWNASKIDRAVSDKAAVAEGADPTQAGNYSKSLISKQRLAAIRQLLAKLSKDHYHLTSPYLENSDRILTVDLYQDYLAMIMAAKDQLNVLVQKLKAEYPQAKREAQGFLGAMYDESLYPHVDEFDTLFSIDVEFAPMPDSDKVKAWAATLGAEQTARLEEKHEKAQQSAIDQAHEHVVQRLVTRATDFLRRLEEKDAGGQIRHEVLEHLISESQLIAKGLGIKDDAKLMDFADEIRAAVADVSIEALRTSVDLRQSKGDRVKEALAKFQGVLG